jgi:hypothetical protein
MCDTNWYVVRREYQDQARHDWNYKHQEYLHHTFKTYWSSIPDAGYVTIPIIRIEDGSFDKSEDGIFTYASETADSSQYVIYYSYQRELWADSQDIRDYEQDAIDCGIEGVAEIQQFCVYMALQDAISETLTELLEEELSNA